MTVLLIVIIAVASGLACLTLLLVATLCLLKQRRKDIKHLGDELGSLEDRLSPVKRIRSNPQIQRPRSQKGKDIGTLAWPMGLGHTRDPTPSLLLLKPSLSSLSRHNDTLSVPANTGVSRATTIAERSQQSISIYSTESAPLHFHDQLSNPIFMNRVVMGNITKATLPQGMNLPSCVTRDIGLFITPLSKSGTANRPSSSPIRLRDNTSCTSSGIPSAPIESSTLSTTVRRSARFTTPLLPKPPNRAHLFHRGINPQILQKTDSTSSFPPPLW